MGCDITHQSNLWISGFQSNRLMRSLFSPFRIWQFLFILWTPETRWVLIRLMSSLMQILMKSSQVEKCSCWELQENNWNRLYKFQFKRDNAFNNVGKLGPPVRSTDSRHHKTTRLILLLLQTAWSYARNGHVLGRVPRALRPPRGDKLRGREADQPPVWVHALWTLTTDSIHKLCFFANYSPLWIWRLQPERQLEVPQRRQLHRHAVLLPIQVRTENVLLELD